MTEIAETTALDPEESAFITRCILVVPYWIETVTRNKDAGILLLSDIDHSDAMLARAMEETGIPYLDFTPIGRMHKVVDDWLYRGLPLNVLTDKELARSDRDAFAEDSVTAYVMSQPEVDACAYGAPLVLTTLYNLRALNEMLEEIWARGLDEDEGFKTNLRTMVEQRALSSNDAPDSPEKTQAIELSKTAMDNLVAILAPAAPEAQPLIPAMA